MTETAIAPAPRTHGAADPATEEELRCRRYGDTRVCLLLIEFSVLLLVLASLTLTGTARPLLAGCHPATLPRWMGDLSYLLLLGVIARAAVFPFQFLDEYWLEHRYGLSRQGLAGWLWEWVCRSTVVGVAVALMLLPVVETLRWWVWLVIPWSVAYLPARSFFFDCVYTPLLSLFYPVRYLGPQSFELPGVGKKTLPVYCIRVGHKTRCANAAIRLRGRKTAVFLTDTLCEAFTEAERRVVLAHEFGHLYDQLHLETHTRAGIAQAQRKLLIGTAQLLAGTASLALMQGLAPVLGLRGVADLAGFPLLAAMTLGLGTLLGPLLCAEARRDERDADEYALAITGDVEDYLSVMSKLREMNLEERCARPLSRFFFDTHPSYDERVRLAHEYHRRFRVRRRSRHGHRPHDPCHQHHADGPHAGHHPHPGHHSSSHHPSSHRPHHHGARRPPR